MWARSTLFRSRCLAWHLLIEHGCIVKKGSHDGRRLFHIVSLNAIEDIHIRMVRACAVFDIVLDELKSRKPDGIEREVIGAACIRDRKGRSIHLFEGQEPFAKDGADGLIALQIDSANFASAVVEVEIDRKLIEVG